MIASIQEIETETREMLIYICMVCECWSQELDSEVDQPICGNCGNQDVRIEMSYLIDVEVETVSHV